MHVSTPRRQRLSALLLAVVALIIGVGAPTTARARTFLPDQENTTAVISARLVSFFAPLGQEFVPTVPQLDLVQLRMFNAAAVSGAASVRIRADTIAGTILGTSATVDVLPGPADVYDVRFPASVALTPGHSPCH